MVCERKKIAMDKIHPPMMFHTTREVFLVALNNPKQPRHTQQLPQLEQPHDLRRPDFLALAGAIRAVDHHHHI
jgi:hypothetical protein